jgi:hypothetical protein
MAVVVFRHLDQIIARAKVRSRLGKLGKLGKLG